MNARDASKGEQTRSFDWQAIYDRLARAAVKLEASENPSPEHVRQILRARSEAYLKDTHAADTVETVNLITFELDELQLAITLDDGAAAVSLNGLIKLPGVPALYLGLLGYRGRVYPIVDVRTLVGARRGESRERRYAVLCHGEHGAIGIAATGISGITKAPMSQVAAGTVDSLRNRSISGLSADSRIVIDVEQVLENARLLVEDQPALAARD